MATALNAAKGILAIARAVLATEPDMPLDELATKLGKSLGAKRAEVYSILVESGLGGRNGSTDEPAPEPERPRFIVHIDDRKGVQPFLVCSTKPYAIVMPFDYLRMAQMYCDGLNLDLSPVRAMDRALALDHLVHGDGGTIRFDRAVAHLPSQREAFVCDLLNQKRAWGPFDDVAAANAWRAEDSYLSVWAVTTYYPYSRYYPPELYGLFRKEHPLRYPNPWLNPPKEAPKREEVRADDMTPVILEAMRQYMAFNSEPNRMYGPCRDAYERLRNLLTAGGAAGES